ncbi:hypothetical protein NP511_17940 [Natrinema thermotolerans]|uniref:Uncharacterized protein n=1 Tax=Natrinema thermotolerans TaxID=121872 RepID=A0AAF0PA07_9EURY|nr:hypothetical protein [Natrinema thermotolerans]QCC60240.1 hypothetical protein DVR14_17020 [Natrinema thermotolerans]QCC61152.1 hypothetical protein DVR14_21150 [Natrinema thermotolerans]WMT07257.1 hypothetical protein NP511_17940 [Natrinema thermotolerans]
MKPIEGLDESTCEELQEAHSKLEENKQAIIEDNTEEVREKLEGVDDVSYDDLADALAQTDIDQEKLEQLNRVQEKVRYTTSLGCGLDYREHTETEFTPPDDDISGWVVNDAYTAVDEAGTGVRATTPDYIYSGDMVYDDIAGEENQKRVFQDEVNRTLDQIEDLAETEDISLPTRATTGTAVAMQIECKMMDDEAEQECLEQYSDFDVKSSGLSGVGDPLPSGYS